MKRTADGWIASSMRSLQPMRVYQPATVAEAASVLDRPGSAPVILAGGTDLVAQFNEGLTPHDLVAVRGIDALRRIVVTDGELRIGSCVTHEAGSQSDVVRSVAPGFAAAWGKIANVRVRMTATIGGNVMARRTRYEMPILLEALGATMNFSGVLLLEVAIPLDGLIAFDYDRSLRPVLTQAACLRRRADGSLALRAAIGTEARSPHGFSADVPFTDLREFGGDAQAIALAAYADVPTSFSDAYTTNAYVRRAGSAILKRQVERLARAAA